MANKQTATKKRKRKRFSWFRLLGLVIAVLLVIQLHNVYQTYCRMQQEVAAYQQQLAVAQAEYDEVVEKKELLNNDSYIERLARENLGMVKPGEVRVTAVKVGEDGAAIAGDNLDYENGAARVDSNPE